MAEQASKASQPACCPRCRQLESSPCLAQSPKLAIETGVLGGVIEEQGRCARPTSPASIVDSWKPVVPVSVHSYCFCHDPSAEAVVDEPLCSASHGSTSEAVPIHIIVT
jgi:hypothetical protein